MTYDPMADHLAKMASEHYRQLAALSLKTEGAVRMGKLAAEKPSFRVSMFGRGLIYEDGKLKKMTPEEAQALQGVVDQSAKLRLAPGVKVGRIKEAALPAGLASSLIGSGVGAAGGAGIGYLSGSTPLDLEKQAAAEYLGEEYMEKLAQAVIDGEVTLGELNDMEKLALGVLGRIAGAAKKVVRGLKRKPRTPGVSPGGARQTFSDTRSLSTRGFASGKGSPLSRRTAPQFTGQAGQVRTPAADTVAKKSQRFRQAAQQPQRQKPGGFTGRAAAPRTAPAAAPPTPAPAAASPAQSFQTAPQGVRDRLLPTRQQGVSVDYQSVNARTGKPMGGTQTRQLEQSLQTRMQPTGPGPATPYARPAPPPAPAAATPRPAAPPAPATPSPTAAPPATTTAKSTRGFGGAGRTTPPPPAPPPGGAGPFRTAGGTPPSPPAPPPPMSTADRTAAQFRQLNPTQAPLRGADAEALATGPRKPLLSTGTKAMLGVGALGLGATHLGGKTIDFLQQPQGQAYQYGMGSPSHFMNPQQM